MAESFHLECTRCARTRGAEGLPTLCECGAPWWVRYPLKELAARFSRRALADRPWTLWRYEEVLPLYEGESPVTLGEGGTPLVPARRLAAELGVSEVWVKDEGKNPTGTFKARGLSAAVTRAACGGTRSFVIPSAGNAASALAAYGARAGCSVRAYVPVDTPRLIVEECRRYGAEVIRVDGLISHCAQEAQAWSAKTGAFDVSTLREPYRIEGKKTMAYEIAEQLDGRAPDAIVYPTGGGTGLIGMWKAFDEMQELGWLDGPLPRMVCVQAEGCAPMVRAWARGATHAIPWENAQTVASGLRVPSARGDFLILRAVRESGGCALAVADAALLQGARDLEASEGVATCPEGGATIAALRILVRTGAVRPDERAVCLNTGASWKTFDLST